MAAYAAVVSLMNTIEQIRDRPHLSTSLDKKQIQSLDEKLDFLLDFIESFDSYGVVSKEEMEDLESQIASAAHAADEVIESHIVDRILAESTQLSSFLFQLWKQIKAMTKKLMNVQEKIRSKVHQQKVTLAGTSLLINLQKIIEDMDSIKEKVMKVKEEKRFIEDLHPAYSLPAATSKPLTTGKTTMVGFDDELIQLMDVLTGQQSCRQIISIVGMGGMGKTTLARNAYEDLVIMQHFDLRVWATISQQYSVRKILSELLSCQGKSTKGTEYELGERLYKSLLGRRYLTILDDVWSMEVWDKMKIFFPDNGCGSRVVITTRLSNVAIRCGSSCLRMDFLDDVKSWNLFCENVFEDEECPPELEKTGKEIAKLCRGLPLSIVVIGGLLRKSYRSIGYWQNVANNINSFLNSGENEQCLNVLSLSYSHLPAHLKPCFLYMGIFPEDDNICVSRLIKLWVAEGFLKLNGPQNLEEVAESYLNDLIDRNLILVCWLRKNGKVRYCGIHDLLRDLCLRIAEKEKFLRVVRGLGIPRGIDREHPLIFDDFLVSHNYRVLHALPSASSVDFEIRESVEVPFKIISWRHLHGFQLSTLPEFQSVCLRYLNYTHKSTAIYKFQIPSSISLIWNLQTLIIGGKGFKQFVAPVEIWRMPQLRHVECNMIYLPDPPLSDQPDDFLVLGKLQTLSKVVNFRLDEQVCKRIPNIKKLRIYYNKGYVWMGYDDRLCYHLSNVGSLNKLESLELDILVTVNSPKESLTFPSSLKKLSLGFCRLRWEDLTMIGSLPQLEVLKLEWDSTVGSEWNPVDGEFLRLKFLSIRLSNLRCWNAESSHFPVLEKLVLQLEELNEIPGGIGDIPTLELIQLDYCTETAIISAMKMKQEQENLGNNGLRIQVTMHRSSRERFREMLETEELSINGIQLKEY